MDVICIGQATLDVIVRGGEKEIAGSEEIGLVEDVEIWPGGDALNEASVLAGMGYRAEFVGALGRDMAGRMIASELKRRGIETGRLTMRQGKKTIVTNVLVDSLGERRFLVSRRQDEFAEPERLGELSVEAKVVTFGSLFLPPFLDVPQVLKLAARVKASGAVLCADCTVNGSPFEFYKDLWKYVDFFFPNEQEARFFSKKENVEDMADYFLDQGISNVVIKRGAAGCYVKNREEAFAQGAYVTEALDTTGAGDAFEAGFIAGLLDGQDLHTCSKMACGAASLMVRRIGTGNAVKNKKEVLDLLGGGEENGQYSETLSDGR